MSAVPEEANPYTLFAEGMYASMYPKLATGYGARTIALYTLLSYLVVLSLVSVAVTVRKSRKEGKEMWICRLVKQRQGTYLHLNQHFFFPLGSLVLGIFWIVYTRRMQIMWGGGNNHNIYYYLSFVAVPAFVHAWIVTFSVISGANLASSRPSTRGVRHLLAPKFANGILCLLPLLLVALFVTGVRTGGAYGHLRNKWDVAYANITTQAATYDGHGNFTGIMADITAYETGLLIPDYVIYRYEQRINLIVTITCFCILLLINVSGGIGLVSSLRQSDGHLTSKSAPLVAPLADYGSDNGQKDKEATPVAVPSEWYEDPEAYRAGVASAQKQEKGERLDWDVTLYYFLVPVVSAAYLAYAIWILAKFATQSAPTAIEISALIIVWGYGGVSALSMTSVMLKNALWERKKVTPVVGTFDNPQHTVTGLRSSSHARRRSWTDSVVGPLEGHLDEEDKRDL